MSMQGGDIKLGEAPSGPLELQTIQAPGLQPAAAAAAGADLLNDVTMMSSTYAMKRMPKSV